VATDGYTTLSIADDTTKTLVINSNLEVPKNIDTAGYVKIYDAKPLIISRMAFGDATTREFKLYCDNTPANSLNLDFFDGATTSQVTNITSTTFSVLSTTLTCLSLSASGTISGNLNSTKGQLVSYSAEQSTELVASTFCFGHSSRFGMNIPFECKLKKFCYSSNAAIGSAFTTGTIIVFRLYADDVAQALYAFCDFGRVEASTANRRIIGKFSSSPTVQTDTELSISTLRGTNLSWYCYSLTSYPAGNTEHRFSVVVETIENL
jgi:hypothetical protein